ncbi:hypothetical protein Ocin01_08591 [Orchesella cincta]|uniref:Uncharacterized protein n=1 Tax=Orchesella cincta TaxID=48709 RepID=A0A1D2MZK5_ORCCI|nr:hypothetical protein Ocin01_08591 [Orchesella cincta]
MSESTKGKNWESKKEKKLRKQQKLLEQIDKAKKKLKEDGGDNTTKNSRLNSQSSEEGGTKSLAKNGEKKITGKGRAYTVSIAVAGSIIDNAQTPPLKAYLAGQVARAAAIFCVDEVIIYDDTGGHGTIGCEQMARILQFLECPQYLRKLLFPIHPDLQYAGLIAPLDVPHHLRRTEALPYREGVVSSKPMKDGGKDYALVNVGLDRDCHISKKLPQGVRVTVKFDDPDPDYILKPKGKLKGTVVSPHLPRREDGLYWGYTVRIASSLGKVFSECPFREGYDVKVGTSAKGSDSRLLQPQPYNHLLVVFGGVEGLEYALENDEGLEEGDVSKLFDHYVNAYPSQGKIPSGNSVGEEFSLSLRAMSRFITK